MIYEAELLLGQYEQFSLTVAIEFDTFNRNNQWGSSIKMIRLLGVAVTSVSNHDLDLSRDDLEAMGGDESWAEYLDRKAFHRVKELVNAQDWLYDHLCHFDRTEI